MPRFYKNPNYTFVVIAVLIVGVIIVALIIGENKPKKSAPHQSAANSACGPYRKDGVMEINYQKINVEIAYSLAAKEKGLAGRPCILANQGMLFDFGREGQYRFWMKGVKFPIDIIWINNAHLVAGVERNISPSTYYSKYPFFTNDPNHPARYVLELKANRSLELNINLGTPVTFQKTQSA